MKIGDRVRFLSEVGGGRVAGFQGKNIVLVEDEDGFQVPMPVSEVVVIGTENYDTGHVVEVKKRNAQQAAAEEEPEETEPADKPVTFVSKPMERQGGDLLSAYLAFVPMSPKELSQTRFESFFVNDSNYYLRFAYFAAQGNSWHLKATYEVEPNTKLFIEEFGREDLGDLERVAFQMMAYKREKGFMLKPAIDVQLRIDAMKFYKLHAFQENNFFEQPAIIYPLVEKDRPIKPLVMDARQLKTNMYNPQSHQ